ncbi:MAG: nuclear transport factor 2 family protein [Acidobacteriales bacterium]|nr:nuclear transport factor 2 family protein [Terriglobales bacterium]
MKRDLAPVLALLLLFGSMVAPAQPAKRPTTSTVERVVADYTGLYNAKDLEEWRKLFHPDLVVTSPASDGRISIRNLKQFYNAQKKGFDAGTKMSERLQNIAIERGHRIAQVAADFIFTSEGKPSRGTLGLHLVQGKEGWKITAIVYSYDPGQEPR